MRYLSVCSGIEAASAAWHPLGWRCNGVAEIEAFPSAVLAHHYPQVHNFGDITKFKDWPNDPTIDVLVGGTPCQSFSVAGLRKGLADPRGNLALTFLGIADRYGPEWIIWENVPGVLSQDKGGAFGSILGGMAELGYHVSYRVLDAQYVRVDGIGRAVPQRRRRVFVVGNIRDWRRAAAVLFEPESLSWNTAPRRETGKGIAPTISARTKGGGGLGTDFDCDGGLVTSTGDVAHCLNAGGRQDYETETVIAHALRADGFDASEDGTGRGTPLIPIAFAQNQRDEVREVPVDSNNGSRRHNGVVSDWAVRRLTPVECEKLQGFPPGYTDVPYRGKKAADGPRYKALGNSMAVNCMRWIGRRIELVSNLTEQLRMAA
jgi:DNA (cytosine-5)-methyltransferase 1